MEPFRVAILTPYLSEAMTARLDSAQREEQVEFGLDEPGLQRLGGLTAGALPVQLEDVFAEGADRRKPHFAIAGSTVPSEIVVGGLRGSGVPIARYSIFYGLPSEYTGRTPAEGGYAMDIPKDVDSVIALLTHEETVRAIQERDAQRIRRALKSLDLQPPLLPTSFLEEALR